VRYNRIILLGFPKTGNTTIHNTLRHLGYDSFIQHWTDVEPAHMAEPDNIEASQKLVLNIPENSGAALGTLGQLSLWKQYTERYPDALFVLNTRSDRSHLTSIYKHAWYDWGQNGQISTWKTSYWPPNAQVGFRRLSAKHKHESNIEQNIGDVAYICVDIGEPGWQDTLVKLIDPNADINKLLTTGYSYPGFQFESVQMRSKLTELHSNYRLDSSLPVEYMNEINSVVDATLDAIECDKQLQAHMEKERYHLEHLKTHRTAAEQLRAELKQFWAESS